MKNIVHVVENFPQIFLVVYNLGVLQHFDPKNYT